jgi:O-antigen ligase
MDVIQLYLSKGPRMKPFEKYLNSGYYIMTVLAITYVSWLFKESTPPFGFNVVNMIGMMVLLFLMTTLLVLYRNTLYITPIIVGILYIISRHDLTFDTTAQIGFPHVAMFVFLLGPVIHYFKFKPVLKKGALFWGLLLIAIAYIIPILYTPFEYAGIAPTFIGLVYFLFYVILVSTVEGRMDYLMKIMLGLCLLLSVQLYTVVIRGMISHADMPFYNAFYQGVGRSWYSNFGWGNINDVVFYISLTFPSIAYFIIKHPNRLVYWLMLFIPSFAVALSGSRGGLIGFSISFGAVAYVLYKHRSAVISRTGIYVVAGFLLLLIINYRIVELILLFFMSSLNGGFNTFTSFRIEIYLEGLKIFMMYPLFGGGWLSINWFEFDGRLFMFHSTIIHVLATMGLFGLGALILHYKEVLGVFIRNITLEKKLLLAGYGAVQIHGLVENVQFSVQFSVLVVLIFSIIETSKAPTIFKKVDREYLLL